MILKLKELLQEKSQHGDKYVETQDYKDQRACKKFNILYNIRVTYKKAKELIHSF